MILDARSGLRGLFVRADTRQPIRFVRWYDTETEEFEAFRCDPDIAKSRGIPLRSLLYRGRCKLEFKAAPIINSPFSRRATSTPLEEIRREILRGGEIKVRPILVIPGQRRPECDEPKCHREAEWAVAVERLVEPEKDVDGKPWERAVTVGSSLWCSWHYRPPRQFSERGVESELEVVTRPS